VALGVLGPSDVTRDHGPWLARDLPKRLSREVEGSLDWHVEVADETFTLDQSLEEILETGREWMRKRGWELVICLIDLPLYAENRPLVAEVSASSHVAVLSLPALGGLLLKKRMSEATVRIADALVGEQGAEQQGDTDRLAELLGERAAPIERKQPDEDPVDVRFLGTSRRGRVRLLLGMVRANRPWRLIFGLSSALATALATGAFGLVTNTIWQLSDALSAWRLAVAAIGSVGLMVTWLIVRHGIWEQRSEREGVDAERAALYNATSVLTLTVGVLCIYAVMFVLDLAAAGFVIDANVLSSSNGLSHSVGVTDYLELAWLTTSAAIVGGALGSTLQSEEHVRRVAYGERQRARRIQSDR
jgi:nucleotide-binding universal stress UspA family protein